MGPRNSNTYTILGCDPVGLLQGSLGPFGPGVSPECPRNPGVSEGVSDGVSDGVSPGPFGPGVSPVRMFQGEYA